MTCFQFISILYGVIFLCSCNSTPHKTTIALDHSRNEINPISINEIDLSIRNSLLLSKDFGETWTNVSQDLPHDIQLSFIEKMNDEIVMATDNKGLFKSSEKRTKWTPITANLPGKKINALHIFDQSIYVGVYQKGIFVSTDNGNSWISLNYDLPNLNVQAIWKMGARLFVGTDEGIFEFLENQESWKSLGITAQILSIYDYKEKLVLGTSLGTAYSPDKGASWEWIRKKGAVHYTHNIKDRIVELGLNGDLFFSNDWGANWVESTYAPREWSYIYELVEANGYYIMSNNYGIHRSSNSGKTWDHIYKTESIAIFDFLVIGKEIYGGTRAWDEYRKRK